MKKSTHRGIRPSLVLKLQNQKYVNSLVPRWVRFMKRKLEVKKISIGCLFKTPHICLTNGGSIQPGRGSNQNQRTAVCVCVCVGVCGWVCMWGCVCVCVCVSGLSVWFKTVLGGFPVQTYLLVKCSLQRILYSYGESCLFITSTVELKLIINHESQRFPN